MSRPTGRVNPATLAITALFAFGLPGTSTAQQVDPDQYDQLLFRHIGPVGNRVAAIAGVVGDRLTYYAGAAAGGVWKTVDGGEYWEPVFDDQTDHSIGALAVAASDPAIVWAGTGEPHIRSNVSLGTGVYKSTDGGETWQHMGLGEGGPTRTSRIVIHPTNPDIVYVGALGHTHGPQQAPIFTYITVAWMVVPVAESAKAAIQPQRSSLICIDRRLAYTACTFTVSKPTRSRVARARITN